MSQRTFLLVRHPEAWKNVENRHGGRGTSLTKIGLQQCEMIAQYVLSNFAPVDRYVLVGHRIPQVKESVEYISGILKITPMWDERLCGIDLGVVAGLSRAEAAQQWPEVAERLELWRMGRLRIDQLRIPEAEPLDEFKYRVEEMLYEWLDMRDIDPLVAVCTRSVLIMLVNLVRLADSFSYERYRVYDFDAGSITRVDVSNSTPHVVVVNQLEHLNGIP